MANDCMANHGAWFRDRGPPNWPSYMGMDDDATHSFLYIDICPFRNDNKHLKCTKDFAHIPTITKNLSKLWKSNRIPIIVSFKTSRIKVDL